MHITTARTILQEHGYELDIRDEASFYRKRKCAYAYAVSPCAAYRLITFSAFAMLGKKAFLALVAELPSVRNEASA